MMMMVKCQTIIVNLAYVQAKSCTGSEQSSVDIDLGTFVVISVWMNQLLTLWYRYVAAEKLMLDNFQ